MNNVLSIVTTHEHIIHSHFTPVLALYDPFGVDVPLNFDITHTHYTRTYSPLFVLLGMWRPGYVETRHMLRIPRGF